MKLEQLFDIINNVKLNGFYSIDDFLDSSDLFQIKKIILADSHSKFDNNDNYYLTGSKLSKVKLKKIINIKYLFRSFFLNKIAKKYKFLNIAKGILGKNVYLDTIDGYVSKISSNPVLDWHVDQAYSGRTDVTEFSDPDHSSIKFFIYLTDVHSKNGCMGYIPLSHKIAYFLKKGILNKKIDYTPYWSLKDFRNKIIQKKTYEFISNYIKKEKINDFLDKSNFIVNSEDTTNFDLPLKKGGIIIFDEAGVHRGSAPTVEDRVVCRFHYKRI
jgi:hypothetical protein